MRLEQPTLVKDLLVSAEIIENPGAECHGLPEDIPLVGLRGQCDHGSVFLQNPFVILVDFLLRA